MRGRSALVVAGLVAALGLYGVADATDVAPGVLTTAPPVPDPRPYPALELPGDGLRPPQVPELDPDAPQPTSDGLAALLTDLEGDYRMTGDVAMVVADVATGEVLLSQDPDTPRTTASSVKLLTAVAALDALGPQRELVTRTVLRGPGTLVLEGGGDVLLGAGEGNPDEVNGRAGLADLARDTAEALGAEGTDSVRLVLDDTLFTGPVHAPDWEGVDLTFVMPVQPLAVDAGRHDGRHLPDPAVSAAQVFAEALEEAGVAVTGLTRGTAPAGAEAVAEVRSAPVGAVVRHMLKTSDNSVAEALARLVAVERGAEASFDGATASVLAQVQELGVDVGGTTMADASGLSVRDQVPAGVLVEVLLTALSGEHPQLAALSPALPVAALDGTLVERMRDEAAAGMVRAKTGTLIETVSLTGTVLTADGRHLAFAALLNDLEPGTALQARLAIDDWATDLTSCGCR